MMSCDYVNAEAPTTKLLLCVFYIFSDVRTCTNFFTNKQCKHSSFDMSSKFLMRKSRNSRGESFKMQNKY